MLRSTKWCAANAGVHQYGGVGLMVPALRSSVARCTASGTRAPRTALHDSSMTLSIRAVAESKSMMSGVPTRDTRHAGPCSSPPMTSQITFSSHRGYRFHQGLLPASLPTAFRPSIFSAIVSSKISFVGGHRRAVPAFDERGVCREGSLSRYRRASRPRLLSARLCLVLS